MKQLFKEVNQHFLIRYFADSNSHEDRLVTARQCCEIVDNDELFMRITERAFNSPNEKEEVKLRRGVKFIFVSR